MKLFLYFALPAICACLLSSCAAPERTVSLQRPPAANDWRTEYVGKGSVRTSITNASGSSLFLKVKGRGATAAQVELLQNGTRDVFLAWGGYETVMKITSGGQKSYYRGPLFSIPPNAAGMHLTLQPANTTNLTPISPREFER